MLDCIVSDFDTLHATNRVILKKCPQCKEVKDREIHFGKNKTTGDGYESWCKPCRKRDKQNRKIEHHDWIRSVGFRETVLAERQEEMLRCLMCNEHNYYKIQWHHVVPATKSFEISDAIKSGKSRQDILSELRKCAPLCCNCHTLYHRYVDLMKTGVSLPTLVDFLGIGEPVLNVRIEAAIDAKRKVKSRSLPPETRWKAKFLRC
jgi:hypothetical protein